MISLQNAGTRCSHEYWEKMRLKLLLLSGFKMAFKLTPNIVNYVVKATSSLVFLVFLFRKMGAMLK